jgi:hypothetical protein
LRESKVEALRLGLFFAAGVFVATGFSVATAFYVVTASFRRGFAANPV